ncbi:MULTISPECIES: large conductance mechanosensitive channel protein MscL [Carnobacterium]|nr:MULTISPECIES: large conductance mechanosensitive channel protein MscL [Carnobacterium]MBQ6484871.1 large conductance mechanosensitive channel protein MscL [Carnobacterium sp.]MCI1817703.1 large conductance mechanosensitive channel protein MscL [Carnobacterium maltaromaticum]MDT1943566.1 large conductance mechanosensitive channel protein MscL [Carnobacterium maltaromaticum]MDT1998946.1 large conductance mechanosensitive channel protein MscL [Carnobacterium maltaromaticum]MDW5524588.1 large c
MLAEFKEFALRGSVLDLAVGVVIGGAFSAIVTSLVTNIITPIIVALTGGSNISDLSIKILNAKLMYGAFLQSIIDFLIIAFSIFMFIKVINTFVAKMKKPVEEVEEEVEINATEEYLKEIRDLLAQQNKEI